MTGLRPRRLPPLLATEEKRRILAVRLERKLDRGEDVGRIAVCWFWRGARIGLAPGVPAIDVGRGVGWLLVVRALWELEGRGSLAGLVLRTDCDNDRCCRPAHVHPVPAVVARRRALGVVAVLEDLDARLADWHPRHDRRLLPPLTRDRPSA